MMNPEPIRLDVLVFQPAAAAQRPAVLHLLQSLQLPTADIDEKVLLYLLLHNNRVVATGGLEFYGSCALLRSVGVDALFQGRGFGGHMTRELECLARQAGVKVIFLLTTSAEAYFSRQGYTAISREEAPEDIRQTSQFTSLCPASAVVMRKGL